MQFPWLAVAPGAAHATKVPPKAHWLAILRATRERLGARASEVGLVLLGGTTEAILANELIQEAGWLGPVRNETAQLSLADGARMLKACRVVLACDSAMVHIAEAVDTPVGALFGPTTEEFGFAPHLPASQAFSVPLGCRPCSRHGETHCRYGDQRVSPMPRTVARFCQSPGETRERVLLVLYSPVVALAHGFSGHLLRTVRRHSLEAVRERRADLDMALFSAALRSLSGVSTDR